MCSLRGVQRRCHARIPGPVGVVDMIVAPAWDSAHLTPSAYLPGQSAVIFVVIICISMDGMSQYSSQVDQAVLSACRGK